MNLPNKLTLTRIGLAIPFVYFLENAASTGDIFGHVGKAGDFYRIVAAIFFIVASLTDWLDGYIARKKNLVTNFGKLMDPLADRILVISALVVFVSLGWLPSWMSIVVIVREFLIGGIRTLAATQGEVIPAGKLGKYKTTSQMIVIIIMLVFGPIKINGFENLYYYMMFIPVILTVWSGVDYSIKAKHYFMNHM